VSTTQTSRSAPCASTRSLSKSPKLYYVILTAWAMLVTAAMPAFVDTVLTADEWHVVVVSIASALFVAYFWLNGMKDIVYTAYYHLWTKHQSTPVPVRHCTAQPHVVMVYCTYNDFSAESLEASMVQDYTNYAVVILDDSTKPEHRARIDAFAATHGILVVRREDNVGFKAGNLNNYLGTADYDYFVILDSDEITPPNFINRALDYFAYYDNVGIVQANHVATRNRNDFMGTFSIGVDSHWITYQSVKDRHGFLSLLGHGAMVSRDCYVAAGGFPHMVAEDLCMTIAARDVGYVTAFAPDIVCEEEYPVDYLAFKKRHSKWTQGNMEFIKRFTGRILRTRMAWFEKLDLVLFTYSLPLTALFSLYVVLHVIWLPLINERLVFPLWMIVPTAVFLIAPMLNDIIFHLTKVPPYRLLRYLGHSILLYGSMFFVSLMVSVKSAIGGSVFLITPKEDAKVTFREAVMANKGELAFGLGLAFIATALIGNILPVFLLAIPALSATYLTVLHNQRTRAS
jgi:cellulose synthase/poly-beta-1,6-N-acetylglucosamine synthase-like glycosyltransferase